jgi:Zn-dependent alcohol dehydrogenase
MARWARHQCSRPSHRAPLQGSNAPRSAMVAGRTLRRAIIVHVCFGRSTFGEGEQSAKCIVFGLGGIGLNVIQGLRLAAADMIIGVDLNNDKQAWGKRFGMTHFVNPKEIGGDLVPYLVDLTKRGADQIGGADYTFDCTGNVTVMRQALEACHRGWGESIIIGVAGAGQEIATRPFQLVTGRTWRGTAFGGARGSETTEESCRSQ